MAARTGLTYAALCESIRTWQAEKHQQPVCLTASGVKAFKSTFVKLCRNSTPAALGGHDKLLQRLWSDFTLPHHLNEQLAALVLGEPFAALDSHVQICLSRLLRFYHLTQSVIEDQFSHLIAAEHLEAELPPDYHSEGWCHAHAILNVMLQFKIPASVASAELCLKLRKLYGGLGHLLEWSSDQGSFSHTDICMQFVRLVSTIYMDVNAGCAFVHKKLMVTFSDDMVHADNIAVVDLKAVTKSLRQGTYSLKIYMVGESIGHSVTLRKSSDGHVRIHDSNRHAFITVPLDEWLSIISRFYERLSFKLHMMSMLPLDTATNERYWPVITWRKDCSFDEAVSRVLKAKPGSRATELARLMDLIPTLTSRAASCKRTWVGMALIKDRHAVAKFVRHCLAHASTYFYIDCFEMMLNVLTMTHADATLDAVKAVCAEADVSLPTRVFSVLDVEHFPLATECLSSVRLIMLTNPIRGWFTSTGCMTFCEMNAWLRTQLCRYPTTGFFVRGASAHEVLALIQDIDRHPEQSPWLIIARLISLCKATKDAALMRVYGLVCAHVGRHKTASLPTVGVSVPWMAGDALSSCAGHTLCLGMHI